MPWTYEDPPAVAQNWSDEEQRACVDAANAVLEDGGTDEEAIYACIAAAGKGARHMQHKAYPITKFKALEDEGQGVFEAIVAVFGNVDRVGDKIMPGAFTKSLETWAERERPIPVIFSHNWDDLDAHIGHVIEAAEVDEGLYVKGQLDIEEDFARKVWRKMSQGLLADFSFAYDEIDSKWIDDVHELHELDILEVGPTLVGANPATHLLNVKAALASHSTETTDAAWDGPANEARARSDEDVAYYRRIYAWRDPDGDPSVKSTYKFIHHMVGEGGEPGAANMRACQTGIGILNGGRGGTTVPDTDREGVWSHLARHLRDADLEPPELKTVQVATKAGARHTAKEYEMLQSIHDMVVELGAECPGHGDESDEGGAGENTGATSSAGKRGTAGDGGQGGGNASDYRRRATPRSARSLLAARVVFGDLVKEA